jgi:flagellar biogenesis protein FliO
MSEAAVPTVAASGAIPYKVDASPTGMPASAGSVLILVLLCAAAGASLYGLRRTKGNWGKRVRAIHVVETQRLGERGQLSLVHYNDRALLLAHGEHGVTVLADHPVAPPAGETP